VSVAIKDNVAMIRTVPPRRPRACPSRACALALAACTLLTPDARAQSRGASDWGFYGGDAFGRRFSSLEQINRGNVAHLELAWLYRTGERGH
jgi:glucose dehydrogenase